MNRSASAVWRGTGRDGKGTLTTQSGVLDGAAYAFTTRFENEKGTNPEELIAAAHAGCFTMALAFALQRENLTPNELKTEAVVTLDKDGAGFKVTKSALTLAADVPGIDKEKFGEIAKGAKEGCPISKLLNAEITLDWSLA
ncbi:OsmC family protein [Phreatobacter sp. HK31-P]|nr:OsmC family protein [Phreatobacter sp.]